MKSNIGKYRTKILIAAASALLFANSASGALTVIYDADGVYAGGSGFLTYLYGSVGYATLDFPSVIVSTPNQTGTRLQISSFEGNVLYYLSTVSKDTSLALYDPENSYTFDPENFDQFSHSPLLPAPGNSDVYNLSSDTVTITRLPAVPEISTSFLVISGVPYLLRRRRCFSGHQRSA